LFAFQWVAPKRGGAIAVKPALRGPPRGTRQVAEMTPMGALSPARTGATAAPARRVTQYPVPPI
jgi:hypothetical protein